MSLGEYIKTIRHRRGLSQWELSRLSGLTRSHLSRLELDDVENPSAETFLSLAKSLKVHPNDLYQAAGYIEKNTRFTRSAARTPDEAFAELEVISLDPVRILDKINTGVTDVVQYGQWEQSKEHNSKVIGLLTRGFSLEPEIREGDVILIDQELLPSPGNVVLCYHDEKVQLSRYQGRSGSNGSSYDDLHIYGVVVGINRKLI
jgi:transcriptional regulator with XRE-family HTH domain